MLLKQFLKAKAPVAVVEKEPRNVIELSLESYEGIESFSFSDEGSIQKELAALKTLTEIKDTMKSLRGRAATDVVLASVESANIALGTVDLEAIQTLSMESFDESPEFTLSVSLEGLGDAISKLKETIKKKLSNFETNFKLFTNSLSISSKGILKSSQLLEDQMKERKGGYKKSTDLVSAKNLRGLLINNEIYDKDFSEFKAIAGSIHKEWHGTADKMSDMTFAEIEEWRATLGKYTTMLPGNVSLKIDGYSASAKIDTIKMTTTEVEALDAGEIEKNIATIKKVIVTTDDINKTYAESIVRQAESLYDLVDSDTPTQIFTAVSNGYSSFYDALVTIADAGNTYAKLTFGFVTSVLQKLNQNRKLIQKGIS